MGKAFDSIMQGLDEIEAHERGTTTLRAVTVEIEPAPRYDARAVKKLRNDLRLSQVAFAQVLGVSTKTVEAWEAGRNIPNGSACRLIELITNDATLLERDGIVQIRATPRRATARA